MEPRPLVSDYPVTPWCEVGIGDVKVPSGQARWDVDRWDDAAARWSGVEPTWLDRSCEVHTASSAAGRDRIGDPFAPGGCEITFRNADGWADLRPAPTLPATLYLRPGRQVRYGVDTPTGRHVLYRGFIDVAEPSYAPSGGDVTTVACTDALGEAGRATIDPVADPGVGAGESVAARIGRVLDAAGWHPSKRDVQPSSVPLLATTLGAPAIDLLTRAADSGAGAVFGTLDAAVAYRPRDWQTYAPDTPPAAVVGNVEADDVCPQSWELAWHRSETAVVVKMGRPDGTVVTAVDVDALAVLGPEPFDRLDLETADVATLTMMADRVLAVRGMATMPRVGAVTLDAATDPGDGRVVELMATARPETPTRIRCRLVTDSGRDVFDGDYLVTAVTHTITDAGRWTCRLGLDVAAPFAAAHGRWDTARWDRAVWATAP